MFVVTMNRKTLRKVVVVAVCAVITVAAAFAAVGVSQAVSAAATPAENSVQNTDEMVEFLLGYGVEADAGSAEVTKVRIPKKFDDDFKAFNEVIKTSGMDLEKYRGKEADKWVLEAPNKTVESEKAYAVLLVRSDKVIGAYLIFQPSGNVEALSARPALAQAETEDPAAVAAPQTDSSQVEAGAEADSVPDDGIPKVGAQGIIPTEADYTEADMPTE
ncbi:MAG: DUF4830 domain-containing protein [Oscillospiraceae bacterium]|nr:DUF4830 domain-containing protein [Oscillospiraceae bacterium]